jgi:hypothetical protein
MLAEELKPPDDESRRRASLTALVNGVVFSLMPLFVMLVGGALAQQSSTSTIVRPQHSWDGVFEAAVCGFVCALPILAPGIVTQPTKAPPYILVYGGLGAIIGLIVGLVLRTTALLTLRLSRRVAAGVIDYPQP